MVDRYNVRHSVPIFLGRRGGYTIVELMVTIVIVSVLAAAVGTFFVKLLTIQENDREEAYIRERLIDVCGAYADDLSVGKSFSRSNNVDVITYRHETGGVSLETGRVTHVAHLTTLVTNRTVRLDVNAFMQQEIVNKRYDASGDASLIPLIGDMVSFRVTPLNGSGDAVGGNWTSDAALGRLEAMAKYRVKDKNGQIVEKSVIVERVVRLWNAK